MVHKVAVSVEDHKEGWVLRRKCLISKPITLDNYMLNNKYMVHMSRRSWFKE